MHSKYIETVVLKLRFPWGEKWSDNLKTMCNNWFRKGFLENFKIVIKNGWIDKKYELYIKNCIIPYN